MKTTGAATSLKANTERVALPQRVNEMKRRLFVPLVVAGVAAASGVASANSQYWRENGLLLEVSADPRDGTDLVRVDATRANQLELIALNAPVKLRSMTLHFADGRAMSRQMSNVRPGQPMFVDLPQNCAAITSVELDYGDPALRRHDRTAARLQIVPRMTRTQFEQPQYYSQQYQQPTYTYPSSSYYAQQPRYTVVQPRRTQASWQIEGRFRF